MSIRDVSIIDVDVNSGGVNNSVWVELVNQDMIKHFKKLDGVECLGELLKVRCLGEETTQTNIQAAVIATRALEAIKRGGNQSKKKVVEALNQAELDTLENDPNADL